MRKILIASENVYSALLPLLQEVKEMGLADKAKREGMWDDEIGVPQRRLLKRYFSMKDRFFNALNGRSFRGPSIQEVTERFVPEMVFLERLAFFAIKRQVDQGQLRAASQNALILLRCGQLLQDSEGGRIYTMLGADALLLSGQDNRSRVGHRCRGSSRAEGKV